MFVTESERDGTVPARDERILPFSWREALGDCAFGNPHPVTPLCKASDYGTRPFGVKVLKPLILREPRTLENTKLSVNFR